MNEAEYALMYRVEDSHWWFQAKRLFAAVFLNLAGKKFPKILDIGCGTGSNLLMLKSFGEPFGVDISPLAIKFCRQRNLKQIKQGGAEKLPFKAGFFDLVTFFDILYHRGIKSDIKALKEAYRAIKPGGFLLVNDCAHQWLFGPHDLVMQARQRYSKQELTSKITRAGFKIRRASYTNFFTFPLFLINRLLRKIINSDLVSDVSSLPLWLNKILVLISVLESKLLKYFNMPIGSSIMVLAQKT